jgi:hypothetical protein
VGVLFEDRAVFGEFSMHVAAVAGAGDSFGMFGESSAIADSGETTWLTEAEAPAAATFMVIEIKKLLIETKDPFVIDTMADVADFEIIDGGDAFAGIIIAVNGDEAFVDTGDAGGDGTGESIRKDRLVRRGKSAQVEVEEGAFEERTLNRELASVRLLINGTVDEILAEAIKQGVESIRKCGK